MNFDEPNQMCSNSSNGGSAGRCSKKQKQKKIPQRGLGVAQLEKIRIEELQKKDSANSTLTSPPRIASPTSSSSLPLPFLNYSSSHSSSSTHLLSPSSKFVNSSQNSILRQPPSIPNIDSFYLNQFNSTGGGFDVGWPSVPTLDDTSHLRKMWNPYELNRHEENSGWDHGILLPPNISLPFESNTIMPIPDILTRELQFSQASSLLMNMPSVNSSSMLNFQMGPSPNQSLYNNISSLWPDPEKMSSAKRPYPFQFEAPPLPSFHNKLVKIARRSNESNTHCGNSVLFNYDPDGSTLHSNANKETGNQNGDFLSLAPPPPISSGWKHSLPHRTLENTSVKSPRSTSLDQKSLFTFFPALNSQNETSSSNIYCNSTGNGEVGGILDLNLKLGS